MNKQLLAIALPALAGTASAHEATYQITATWYEPQTQPKNSIFEGSFVYDEDTHEVSGLTGMLSESMTGMGHGHGQRHVDGGGDMNWLSLTNQRRDLARHGPSAEPSPRCSRTRTPTPSRRIPSTSAPDGWTPGSGMGLYYGFPNPGANPGNAMRADLRAGRSLADLTTAQLNKIAYADCTGRHDGADLHDRHQRGGWGTVGRWTAFRTRRSSRQRCGPGTYALMLAGLRCTWGGPPPPVGRFGRLDAALTGHRRGTVVSPIGRCSRTRGRSAPPGRHRRDVRHPAGGAGGPVPRLVSAQVSTLDPVTIRGARVPTQPSLGATGPDPAALAARRGSTSRRALAGRHIPA